MGINNCDEIKAKMVLKSLDTQTKRERKLCFQSVGSLVVTAGTLAALSVINMPEVALIGTAGSVGAVGTGFALNRAFLADRASQTYNRLLQLNKSVLKKYALERQLSREEFVQTYPNLSGKLSPIESTPKLR